MTAPDPPSCAYHSTCPTCPEHARRHVRPSAAFDAGPSVGWTGPRLFLTFGLVPLLVVGTLAGLIAPSLVPVLTVGLGLITFTTLAVALTPRHPSHAHSQHHRLQVDTELVLSLRRLVRAEPGERAAQVDRQIPPLPSPSFQVHAPHQASPLLGNPRIPLRPEGPRHLGGGR